MDIERAILGIFQGVAKDLTGKWSSIPGLSYDDILSEGYYIYALKPETWRKAFTENNESMFRSYVYQSLNNHLVSNKAKKETRWVRHNYLCNDDMFDAFQSGYYKTSALYQPTPDELRDDIKKVITGDAPEFLNEAWNKITKKQRERLMLWAMTDGSLNSHERQTADKFIMRVV